MPKSGHPLARHSAIIQPHSPDDALNAEIEALTVRREPTFQTMSRWTREQREQAHGKALPKVHGQLPPAPIEKVRLIEKRPWGQIEWVPGQDHRTDPVLASVTVQNPFNNRISPGLKWGMLGPIATLFASGVAVHGAPAPVGQFSTALAIAAGICSLPLVLLLVPNAPKRLRTIRSQKITPASAHFESLPALISAMSYIEELTATRDTGLGSPSFATPAWAGLWLAILDNERLGDLAGRIERAGEVAALLLAQPDPIAPIETPRRHWTNDKWWQETDSTGGAKAELDRVIQILYEPIRAQLDLDRIAASYPRDGSYSAPRRDNARAGGPSVVQDTGLSQKRAPVDLESSRGIHQDVRDAFTAFCFDPHTVLARPLLNDVSDELTAAFYVAQESADEAETTLSAEPGQIADLAYCDAVDVLASAWDAADLHARECGVSHLSLAEQKDVRRARRALDLALNPNTPAGERDAAYRAVLTLVAGLAKIPTPAIERMVRQIDAVRRKQLSV